MEEPPRPNLDSTALIARFREVENVTPEALDRLPYGVIKVDRQGVVLAYNEAESRLAQMSPEEVIGRNFFTEVAPCTNVESFAARFRRGIERGKLRETFPFVFEFPRGPVVVAVSFYYREGDDAAWIFVDRSQDSAEPQGHG